MSDDPNLGRAHGPMSNGPQTWSKASRLNNNSMGSSADPRILSWTRHQSSDVASPMDAQAHQPKKKEFRVSVY